MPQSRSNAIGCLVRSHFALLFLVASFSAQGATFLVGTGAGCNFNSIQSGIDAAASNPGPDVVRISNATTWGPGGVSIGQQDVTVDGRFATCTDTVVNGNYAQIVGNATNPDGRPAMITITGGGVRRLQGLQIRNNVRGVNSLGGAINYSGTGELILSDMDVRDNRAQSGGAISSNSGVLTLSDGVLIENNIADFDGGGLAILGDATLFAVGASVSIANNEAYGSGGGILVAVDASAYIASTGLGGRAVLQSNRAAISFATSGGGEGGAIAIRSFSSGAGARVVVFSTNPNVPTRIADNRARERGGGINLEPFFGGATLCLMDVHLSGNSSSSGAALYAEVDIEANSNMVYNVPTRSECVVPANSPAQPVRCARGVPGCNVIEGHVTQTVAGMPTPGAVVTARENIELVMRNAKLIGNTAGNLISAVDAGRVEINTALVAGNDLTGAVMRLGFAAFNQGLIMRNLTIAGNMIASANPSVLFDTTAASVRFNNNLIFQPGRTPLVTPFAIANSATHSWEYNATNAPQVLPNPNQFVLGDARFENAAFDDYRLRVGSTAVNAFAAGPSVDATLDLDGRSRPIPLSIFPLDTSNDDVGAFERQQADPWLVNGSFSASAQLRYWEPSANGEAVPGVVWDAQDAAGSPGSGSALVNLPASLASRLTVLRRCFNVPAPGRYTITAKAQRVTGINADNALLSWRVRDSDATCSSTSVQGSGDVAFVGGNGFQPLAAPLQIDLASTTVNSTIEIRLDAVSGLNLNGLTNVRFDDVGITGAPLVADDVFANGFE
jgi:hypothetical protein